MSLGGKVGDGGRTGPHARPERPPPSPHLELPQLGSAPLCPLPLLGHQALCGAQLLAQALQQLAGLGDLPGSCLELGLLGSQRRLGCSHRLALGGSSLCSSLCLCGLLLACLSCCSCCLKLLCQGGCSCLRLRLFCLGGSQPRPRLPRLLRRCRCLALGLLLGCCQTVNLR